MTMKIQSDVCFGGQDCAFCVPFHKKDRGDDDYYLLKKVQLIIIKNIRAHIVRPM